MENRLPLGILIIVLHWEHIFRRPTPNA